MGYGLTSINPHLFDLSCLHSAYTNKKWATAIKAIECAAVVYAIAVVGSCTGEAKT